jgi:serine/threonine-protein phosphatase 4 regulatory subunit 1
VRVKACRELADAAREQESPAALMPLFHVPVRDPEPAVRTAAAEAVPDFTEVILRATSQQAQASVVIESVLPELSRLCADRSAQARQAAADAVVAVAAQLDAEDVEAHVVPIAMALTGQTADEELRAQAAAIASAIAPALGMCACNTLVVPLLLALADDSVFRVRKASVANLAIVADTIGQHLTTERLLPMFAKLCKDSIWGVRKACAEIVVAFGRHVAPEQRRDVLIPAVRGMLDDQSRWVRSAAFQSLGPFLSLLVAEDVTPAVLRYYTDMALEQTSQRLGDSDVRHFCAFSFPGVLQTLGACRWTELSETFYLLAADLQWKVRKTLAFSLHEVAAILGPAMAEQALVPTFELFFRDIDEVRVGVVASFARLLSFFDPESRERFLPFAAELLSDSNWRVRKLFAKQLGHLSVMFPLSASKEFFQDAALQLAADPVAAVRRVAALSVSLNEGVCACVFLFFCSLYQIPHRLPLVFTTRSR